MSADNWTQCPRCLKRRAVEIENKETQVAAAYGKVPVDQFDRQRAELESLKTDRMDNNFREDYEICGAEDGVVEVTYRGVCGICNLRMEFKHSHEIDLDS
jgi:hypothetical protein